MNVNFVLFVLLTAGVNSFVSAQPYYPERWFSPGTTQQAPQPGPVDILDQGLRTLRAFAGRQDRPGGAESRAFLEQEIAPYFDFAYMARSAGGRMWRQMGPEQRRDLEHHIKRDFLTTLATRLTRFDGQQVKVMRSRRGRGGEVNVGVAVLNPGSYPAQLSFRFYRSSEGWKVFDVSANGSSAVMHYRKLFNQMRRRGGAGQMRHFPG